MFVVSALDSDIQLKIADIAKTRREISPGVFVYTGGDNLPCPKYKETLEAIQELGTIPAA